MPELSHKKRIFVKYNDNKKDYIDGGITSSDYLIDDYTKNLIDWKNAGGTGIKYLNGINHTNKTWEGFLLKNSENLYTDLEQILVNDIDKNFNEEYLESYHDFCNAVDDYRRSIGKSIEELLNAEIKMKDAKTNFLRAKEKILSLYEVNEKSRWFDNGDIVIHYQINFKDGKTIQEGYSFIDAPATLLTKDSVINHILKTNLNDKIDITTVSPELKSLVDDILSIDTEGSHRIYDDDLKSSWDLTSYEVADKMKNIEQELNDLGIRSLIEINYIGEGLINYIDVKSEIISEFDFTKEYQKSKFEKKVFDYNINGKDVRCELEYDEKLGGYSVVGYTVDKQSNNPNLIQQSLSKEELSEIKGKLLNEINCLFEEQFSTKNEYEPDITDDMY